ncbi:MAG: FtsX-like permease family protein [Rikenellaceae bacterium]
MSVEYFIAKRSAETKNGGKASIMVRVATISVALSVAMMTITLAIVFGFRSEVSRSLTGFTAEAIMSNIATFNGSQTHPITRSSELESLVVTKYKALDINPYATLQGVVRTGEAIEGVMVRGIDSLYDTSFLRAALIEGELPRTSEQSTTRDILLSSSLAGRLALSVGDRIELLVGDSGESLRRDLFKVCGLFSTGLDEWDRMIMVTDIRNIQRLNSWSEDQISGYDLRFASLKEASAACDQINDELLYSDIPGLRNIMALPSDELYPSIFDWLKAHNINAVVIIVIMLLVAGFNMATALLIMVLERTRMIGTLKALGMSNRALQQIFLYRSLSITLKGLAWGNGIALSLCLAQHHFHIIKLDAASYLLSHVPIDLSLSWIALLNVVVVAVILALMIIPTRIVARVKVEKTLKFE